MCLNHEFVRKLTRLQFVYIKFNEFPVRRREITQKGALDTIRSIYCVKILLKQIILMKYEGSS